jgi:hypothetical protein
LYSLAAILTRFFLRFSAHDVALSKQHKSISASDVLKALEMIEFGDLVDKLQAELLGMSLSPRNIVHANRRAST